MTFGEIKTLYENYLIFSYKKKELFKESVSDFKKTILENRNFVKLYSLYNDLSSPQGLTESDATDFLNDGIENIKEILSKSDIPKEKFNNLTNDYKDIDNLVYPSGKNNSLKERLESRKNIISILKQEIVENKETNLKIPLSSMVSVANKTIHNYLSSLDEISKKEVFSILNEQPSEVKTKFETLKIETIDKLNSIKGEENKSKIDETIIKIQKEKFDYLNFYKLKKLNESL